ncbi:MAG: DUF3047 domain-containing protein [Gemmatimonadetes bacterium]|nr:DUF3047 domain-containing protein [Gemmatimonadota bacterium]
MNVAALLAMQALTTLGLAPAGPGLPSGWRLQRVPGVEPPAFRVTAEHVLRVEARGAAARAEYRLRRPLRPTSSGVISWRWRSETPLKQAKLRQRGRDDSPARVVVAFEGGRTIAYSWGNAEGRGEIFPSPGVATRVVIVLRRAEDADGSWHLERRDPFADYRRAFNNAPKAIVAISIGADTDVLKARTVAEVGELVWEGRAGPPP